MSALATLWRRALLWIRTRAGWGANDVIVERLSTGRLFPDEVIDFVQASQPKAWQQLVTRHGGEVMARQKFLKVVADALDHRGTISVLRGTVKDSGVTVRMCWFEPANTLTPELGERPTRST
jgi:dihydroxyacid dehydratase/phosphogluconate dehydratase